MLHLLLSDNESLRQYDDGKYANIEDISRRLFLLKRAQNPYLPDHLLKFELSEIFSETDNLSKLFSHTMPAWVCQFLELNQNRVRIKSEQQNNWQELLTYIPPLWLQSLFLFQKSPVSISPKKSEIYSYFQTYILPNTRYTSIPRADLSQLNYYVSKSHGFHDLHVHLSGASETDKVWQDFLFNPRETYGHLKMGFKENMVKEQLEQEFGVIQPLKYYRLLKIAQNLRKFFFDFLFIDNTSFNQNIGNKNIILYKIINNSPDYEGSFRHPFASLVFKHDSESTCKMSVEMLMHILILDRLYRNPNELLAGLLHFYLLILGLTNRLLVQQVHQNGFDQFQKLTKNKFRDGPEKDYLHRFHQMNGNDLRYIRFLEGRFSPKKTEVEMISLFANIDSGWKKLIADFKIKSIGNNVPLPELSLVAHFIKQPEKNKSKTVRHRSLRHDLFVIGKVITFLKKNQHKYKYRIAGIDAASNEFDAPPEVFAPVYRMMRRAGIRHFTYHAGEDFYHILDGLRAIYEAINFCDLRKSDRIGHATATGVSVKLWAKAVGNKFKIKKGIHLDNLIFCYHLILQFSIDSLQQVLPYIINEVDNLSFEIYKTRYPIKVLEKAWLMRQCCPIHVSSEKRKDARLSLVFDDEEWDFAIDKGFRKKYGHSNPDHALEVYLNYHTETIRQNYDEIIDINPFSILNEIQLEILQIEVLKFMSLREIVIETLPTSNVRIGYHRDFSTYHLINWIRWKKEGKNIPSIVVGTDDTGIFSTNIYNEYANIYSSLHHIHQMPHDDVMDVIKRLEESAGIYRFDIEKSFS
ncbi:hypothetical protein [Emticicia fluvialis]|uniref:hypothetical protein n=1 Tax=Emticicia fluvialis TaxID=2974474 RepID=UPI0021661F5B|nr:hypothetical protein [Emticicia fluvialis]